MKGKATREKRVRVGLVWVVAFSAALLATEARAADFYENRLNTAAAAAAIGDLELAADSLRVAIFGLQGRPPLLTEALVRLALVQRDLERPAEVSLAVDRFLEAERSSPGWTDAQLEPRVRSEFVALLLTTVPRQQIEGVPTLQPLLAPQAGEGDDDAVEGERKNTVAAEPLRPIASEERVEAALAQSRRFIRARRYLDAEKVLVEAVELDPGSRQLRLALLEAATLARHWSTGEAQIRFLNPISDAEGRYLFYAAVVKYEIGELDAARAYMTRAKGRVNSSAYVDDYLRRILGE